MISRNVKFKYSKENVFANSYVKKIKILHGQSNLIAMKNFVVFHDFILRYPNCEQIQDAL